MDRQKPRLLITTSTLPRWRSDSEARFVLDLARHLRPWFEPTVLAPAHPLAAQEERLDDVPIVRYRYAPLRRAEILCYPGSIMSRLRRHPLMIALVPLLLAGLWRAVRAELRSRRYSCVHAHWFAPQGFVQTLGFADQGWPPFVVTSHGGDMALRRYPFAAAAYRRVLRRASAVTVVAPQILTTLGRLAPEYPLDRVAVIPMGVDLRRFTRDNRDRQWAEQHGLRAPVVLFVGRLVEKKGLRVLLQAFATAPLRDTGATLAVLGDGPLRGMAEARVLDLGLAHRIRFLGPLSHDAVAVALASADIYCAPSVSSRDGDEDGMPTVLCEAAASGLPLVGSELAGIPLVVEDGVTGLLVPPDDPSSLASALARLVASPTHRAAFAAAARRHAETFAWPRIAAEYARVLMAAAGVADGSAADSWHQARSS